VGEAGQRLVAVPRVGAQLLVGLGESAAHRKLLSAHPRRARRPPPCSPDGPGGRPARLLACVASSELLTAHYSLLTLFYFPFFAPYFDRPCLRFSTPRQSSEPRTTW